MAVQATWNHHSTSHLGPDLVDVHDVSHGHVIGQVVEEGQQPLGRLTDEAGLPAG